MINVAKQKSIVKSCNFPFLWFMTQSLFSYIFLHFRIHILFVGYGSCPPTAVHGCILHCLWERSNSLPFADIGRRGWLKRAGGLLLLRNWTQSSSELPVLLGSGLNTQNIVKLLIKLEIRELIFRKLDVAFSKRICDGVWRKLQAVEYLKNDLALRVSVWEYRIGGFALDLSVWPRSINAFRVQTSSGASIYVSWGPGFSICNSLCRN